MNEIAKFDPEEYIQYEESLKFYRDLKNSLETAREEGGEEGIEEGLKEGEKKKQLEIARGMKNDGLPIDVIMKYTGLGKDEIDGI